MTAPERVVLVGFMGSGKSTVGPLLAQMLEWSFRDMDAWIEERMGLTVTQLFRERGEGAFRDEEQRVAAEIAGLPRLVVAAGGGAFAHPRTREALQAGALTVWLRCDLEAALARIPEDGGRPLAVNRETIRRLFAEREPSYRLADLIVDTTATAPDEVARQIVRAVREAPEDARR